MPRCECEHGHKLHLVLKALGGGEAGCKYVWPDGDVCPCDRYRPRRAGSVRRSAPPARKAKSAGPCRNCAHLERYHGPEGCAQCPIVLGCLKYQPPRKARTKTMPRCRHCAHPYSAHAFPSCLRCEACPGYSPARGARQKRRTPLAALRRLLWDLFRAYVYERDGNVCISSGAGPLEGSNRHAGHLFNAGSSSLLRWHPKNVHVQSYRDNVTLRGNIGQYTAAFLDRYGVEEFKRLAKLARVVKKWTAPEVSELIEALKRSPADYELLYEQKHCLPALEASLRAELSAREKE